ncbi:MAG: RNA polymerase sigma factor [Lachnospiraceae bacterium]|nr:RNA polymerase sigma factor [Lachnospiraceae bacterium]
MHSSDFSALYRASSPLIRQLVFSISKNQQAVEDIVQDVYLAAWLRFRDNTHPNPMGWLLLTARHKAYDLLRRQIRESEHYVLQDLTKDTAVIRSGLFDNDPNLDLICEASTPYGQIQPLLRPEEFDMVLDHYDRGLSISELADKHQISTSACYMRLHRARHKLKPLTHRTAE